MFLGFTSTAQVPSADLQQQQQQHPHALDYEARKDPKKPYFFWGGGGGVFSWVILFKRKGGAYL